MKNTKFDKLIMLFLLLQPILDIITAWQVRTNSSLMSIGTLLRGIFLVIIIVYLFINKKDRKIIFMFAIYVLLAIGYQYLFNSTSIVLEISNFLKIFYLPFLIYFFNNYENKKIDDKFLTIIYLIYLNLLIVPYLFSFGYDTYDAIYEKRGYIGLFYAGNELSGIIVGLLPIILNYVMNLKNKLLKIFIIVEIILAIILVGTKTLLLGLIIVLGYFYIKYIIKCYKENKKRFKLLLVLPIICLLIGIISIPKTPVYTNLKITLKYYKISSIKDFTKLDNIDNVIFSGRLSYLKDTNKYYMQEKTITKFLGLNSNNYKDIEIDIFDIFYTLGVVGFIVWLLLMINFCSKEKIEGVYKLSFILFILMSLFSGHVLIQPMVNIYVSLLYILNKNKKLS